MRETLQFWCHCAVYAAKGTVAFANDWAWLFGVPVTVVIVQLVAAGSGNSVTGSIVVDALLSGAIAFVVTWLVIFSVRLIGAPAALYTQAGGIITNVVTSKRPLPIALSVDSLGSYMRTSPRVTRLDQAIAKTGRWPMSSDGRTLAFGLFEDLKRFGIADVAEVDALLEKKEELILHSATHWIMKDGVIGGQCVWELCKIMSAEKGKDPHTKKIIDDYLAAKGTGA